MKKIDLHDSLKIVVKIMKTIALDVETTGLPKKMKASINDSSNWPYVVQISWVVLNDNNVIEKICDYIIKAPIVIPQESINIHGITNEKMNKEGVDIGAILAEFMNDYNHSDIIIAHNLNFDKTMVEVELYRNRMFPDINKLKYNSIINCCTMKTGKDICKIIKISKFGKEYYKFPKLSELYEHLFNKTPTNLHNSLVDILVCLRCFYKMRFSEDLLEKSTTFKEIFNQNTSHNHPAASAQL